MLVPLQLDEVACTRMMSFPAPAHIEASLAIVVQVITEPLVSYRLRHVQLPPLRTHAPTRLSLERRANMIVSAPPTPSQHEPPLVPRRRTSRLEVDVVGQVDEQNAAAVGTPIAATTMTIQH